MKKYVFLLLSFVLMLSALSAQQPHFKPGDKFIEYYKKNPPPYKISGSKTLKNMPDSVQNMQAYKKEPGVQDIKFLESCGKIVGVLQYNAESSEYLYDMTGDGMLNVRVPIPIVPAWALSYSQYTKKSASNNADKYLDLFYEIFNKNENPYTGKKLNELITATLYDAVNIDTENRDIIYGIFSYYGFQLYRDPYLNYTNLQTVLNIYLERFNKKIAHPLIFLWMIEESLGVNRKDDAISIIKQMKDEYPDFIPFQVYSWQYEQHPKLKEKKYKELKKKYPRHWIVVQI